MTPLPIAMGTFGGDPCPESFRQSPAGPTPKPLRNSKRFFLFKKWNHILRMTFYHH